MAFKTLCRYNSWLSRRSESRHNSRRRARSTKRWNGDQCQWIWIPSNQQTSLVLINNVSLVFASGEKFTTSTKSQKLNRGSSKSLTTVEIISHLNFTHHGDDDEDNIICYCIKDIFVVVHVSRHFRLDKLKLEENINEVRMTRIGESVTSWFKDQILITSKWEIIFFSNTLILLIE